MLLKSIKDYYNKADFDLGASDINFFKFHPQIRVLLALNGIFFNNTESFLRFLWPFVCVCFSVIGIVFETMIITHALSISDFSLATECFSYVMILFVVLILYPCTLRWRQKLFQLCDMLHEDFDCICKLDQHYRDKFLAKQLTIWQMCVAWFALITLISILYCILPMMELLYMSLFATVDEHMVRPLIFPLWLPKDDPYRSPNYEIFLTCEVLLIGVELFTFGAYVYFLFHYLFHIIAMMDMMTMSIGSLFDGLDERVAYLDRTHIHRRYVQAVLNKRIGQIVNWQNNNYQYADTVLNVYGPVLVYQTLCSSMVICLMAFQVSSQLAKGIFDIRFVLTWFGSCVQLWIPCYLGTILQTKGFSIGEACFQNGWHKTPLIRLVYVDLCLIIMRSQKPIALQVKGIPTLSLETFSSIMSTAYSYFNMLRQMKEEM